MIQETILKIQETRQIIQEKTTITGHNTIDTVQIFDNVGDYIYDIGEDVEDT